MLTFLLLKPNQRDSVVDAVYDAPEGYMVQIKKPTRSLQQNNLMWKLLTEISRQVTWHGRKLHPDDWKQMFSASLKMIDVVPNIDNSGFVALGTRTSEMTKEQMSNLIELIYSFGAEHAVNFYL